jgi:hypothetical protein
MDGWDDDPRLPFAIAAILGMIAGVAAKQAVALSSGNIPRPIAIVADFLVLGIVWVIAMTTHSWKPNIPLEGIALLSACLAMWGPKGIAALLNRFKYFASTAADSILRSYLSPVDPVHRPTVMEAVEREKEEAVYDEDRYAKVAPIRKLRDIIPLEDTTPSDEVELLARMDRPDDGSESDPETNEGGSNE